MIPVKLFPFEIKAVQEDGTFEGYASVFGNKDSESDIIVKGAFKRTIANKKGKWPILWQHDYRKPAGANMTAEEDDHGLKVKGKLFLDTTVGKDAYGWIKNALDAGLSVGLSIGFRIIEKSIEDGIRYLKEIALMEYSIVTFPANEEAQVSTIKAVVNFQDLALASEDLKWSASKAVKRLWEWCGGDETPNWDNFRKGFIIYDSENADKKSSYKLPIADIVDGSIKAVPRAIIAAAARLDATAASAADKASAKNIIEKYYKKMGKPSPFKDKAFTEGSLYTKAMDFSTALQQELSERELYDLRWTIQSALGDATNSVCEDESMTNDDKLSMLGTIYAQYGTAMVSWYSKYFALMDDAEDEPATEPDGTKTTGISNVNKRVLKYALQMHRQAMTMHDEAHSIHKKALTMADSVVNGYASQFDPDAPDKSTQPDRPNQDEGKKEVVSALDSLLSKMSA